MLTHLLTSRRNFLIRASAITAAGAVVTVPIVTVADARSRIEHHMGELHKAFSDLYPNRTFQFGNNLADLKPAGAATYPLAFVIAK